MTRTVTSLLFWLSASPALLLVSQIAHAQSDAPSDTAAPASPTPEAAAAPAQSSPSTPVQAPAAGGTGSLPASEHSDQASAAASPPAPPAQSSPPGYLRIEQDYLSGLQFYAGGSYPLTDKLSLALDIYTAENYPGLSIAGPEGPPSLLCSWWGEFDIGPSLTVGPVVITPMAGIAFDWAAKRATALNAPQLYTTVDLGPVHFESWVWTILFSPFDTPANDYVHTRNWLTYRVSSALAFGPELDFNINLTSKYGQKGLVSLPLGGRVDFNFGTSNVVGVFLGYQTKRDSQGPNHQAAVGRLAFVHNF